MSDGRAPVCCPDVPRLSGTFMSDGCHVIDVHRHKGLLRGLVMDGAPKPRALLWEASGQLSPLRKSHFDLEKIG